MTPAKEGDRPEILDVLDHEKKANGYSFYARLDDNSEVWLTSAELRKVSQKTLNEYCKKHKISLRRGYGHGGYPRGYRQKTSTKAAKPPKNMSGETTAEKGNISQSLPHVSSRTRSNVPS